MRLFRRMSRAGCRWLANYYRLLHESCIDERVRRRLWSRYVKYDEKATPR